MSIKKVEKAAWGVLLLSLVGVAILTIQIYKYETQINEMIEITDQMDRTVRQFEIWANQYRMPPEEYDYSFPGPNANPIPNVENLNQYQQSL